MFLFVDSVPFFNLSEKLDSFFEDRFLFFFLVVFTFVKLSWNMCYGFCEIITWIRLCQTTIAGLGYTVVTVPILCVLLLILHSDKSRLGLSFKVAIAILYVLSLCIPKMSLINGFDYDCDLVSWKCSIFQLYLKNKAPFFWGSSASFYFLLLSFFEFVKRFQNKYNGFCQIIELLFTF